MKFSVLIAAYRAGNYIGKALESVGAQTHADWEVVVVEDGSRDQTESIVKQFAATVPASVRYDNLGENKGVATARSRLLELAQGEAIAFVDADDWWMPLHLQRADEAFAQGADVAIARIQLFDLQTGLPLETYTTPNVFYADTVKELFKRSHLITSSCVAIRRSLVQRVGFFDPAFRIGEDRDYWLRCALAGGHYADTGEITCTYAKHITSTMGRTLLWSQQEVAFYEKYRDLAQLPSALRHACFSQALANYGRLLRASDPKGSTSAFWRAWQLAPFQLSLIPQMFFSASKAALFQIRS